jgi:hypothetical protein
LRIPHGGRANLGPFEAALCVGACLTTVAIFDAEIKICALHAGWLDELEIDVMDVEKAREVEFGERRFDLPGTLWSTRSSKPSIAED